MKRFKNFITEVTLTPTQLQKPNGKTGEPRIDILQRLISTNTPLETEDKKLFIVTDIEAAYKEIARFKSEGKTFDLTGKYNGSKDIITIKTNQLAKSAVFGGGGGSAGGSANTALAESAQAYYCSVVANVLGKQGTPEDFNKQNIQKAAKYVESDISWEDVFNNLTDDWVESSILIANELFNQGYIVKGHRFHRGSKIMATFYKKAKKAQKRSDLTPIADDKWNPGDIWAVKPSFNPESINDSNITDNNKDVLEAFLSRDAVAISLKKAVSKANIKRYNIEPAKEQHDYRGYGLSGGKSPSIDSFFNSKTIALHVDETTLEGRTFNYMTNWALDIKGKNARGGKIGVGPINNAFSLHGVKPLPQTGDIKKLVSRLDKNFYKDFYKQFDAVNKMGKMSYDDFMVRVAEKTADPKGLDWVVAKYMGIAFINKIEALPKAKKDKVLGSLLAFAASSSDVSSAFIKAY